MADGTQATRRPDADLASFWNTEYARFATSRAVIEECGRLRRRDSQTSPYLPPGKDGQSTDPYIVEIPEATLMGQDIINFAGRRRPVARRMHGPGPASQRRASRIETFIQTAMDDYLKPNGEDIYEACLGFATNDGEWGWLVTPSTAHWKNIVKYAEKDETGEYAVRLEWQRDSQGRTREETQEAGQTFELDDRASEKAYAEYLREVKARQMPCVVRLLPAQSCLPIGLDPLTGRVDAMLVKTERHAISLERDGFRWTAYGEERSENTAQGNLSGQKLTLYELHTPGKIQYQVAGPHNQTYETKMVRQGVAYEAIVDLAAEWGITTVIGGYSFGGHHPNEMDLGRRGIPFLAPFMRTIRAVNQSFSLSLYHMARWGWQGKLAKLDPQLIDIWKEMKMPLSFDENPFGTTIIPGDLQPSTPVMPSPAVMAFQQYALETLKDLSPSRGIKASPGDAGFAQAVAASGTDTLLRQIIQGASECWLSIAEGVLEVCTAVARKDRKPVPVWVTVKQSVDADSARVKPVVQTHAELSADDCEGDFRLKLAWPRRLGENLPLAQAAWAWAQGDNPGISMRMWREEMLGVEQPEEVEDEIWVEQQLNSEAGRAYVLEIAARKKANQEMLRIAELQEQGVLSEGLLPTTALPPRPGGNPAQQPGGPPMPGTGQPNSRMGSPAVNGALGGMMAGAMNTAAQQRVIQNTGQAAETAPVGPVIQ